MKTKTKMIAMVEIAVVLCSLFLVALPAIAADQNQTMQKVSASEVTTASKDDYVLDIYGNANEDDTIDMRDLTYVKLIFFGKKPETELADAKYDGKINPLDFIQIKLIIVGKEKELTIVDSEKRIVTVNKPVERIVLISCYSPVHLRTLNVEDKIVGVNGHYMYGSPTFFGELCDLPDVGQGLDPDYEAILSLEPDLVILYTHSYYDEVEDTLESLDITLIRFEFGEFAWGYISDKEIDECYVEEIIKLGYVLDKEDKAEEYCDWYQAYFDKIKSRTEGLPEEDKPRVYSGGCGDPHGFYTFGGETGWQKKCEIIGARNVAVDLSGNYMYVDPEWVLTQNPDIIFTGWSAPGGKWGCYEMDDMTEIIAKRKAILDNPVLAGVDAVESGRVYLSSCFSGGAHIVGLAYMAKWCHPDLFEDLDPQTIHQEYLDRFQRIDYDLEKHGVFVYPKEPVS